MPAEGMDRAAAAATALIGDQADAWERDGRLPPEVLSGLGAPGGGLCAQLPVKYGGIGLTSADNSELTARVGELSSSVRSLMTSQGMAAWTVERLGSEQQQAGLLRELCSGAIAGIAFSEPQAGSDLSAMRTTLRAVGGSVVVDGEKVWVTAGSYADHIVVFGRGTDGTGVVVVPTDARGVTIEPVSDPMGCRAAGHAHVRMAAVRLPVDLLLADTSLPSAWLTGPP
ncbi:acyl-CoA dehydrogenase family protein [Streptomyces sp. NPDC002851]